MSFDALAAAAFDVTETSMAARLVMFALASFHNRDTNACYPGHAAIAERAHISERSVRNALPELASIGLVVIRQGEGAKGDGRRTDAYDLVFLAHYRAKKAATPSKTLPAKLAEKAEAVAANITKGTTQTSEAKASSSSHTKPKVKKKTASSKMHLVPDDWEPKDAHRDKVSAFGWPDGMLEEQLERFREHEFAVGKTDFDRAFHRWLRTCNDDLKGRSNGYRSNRTGAGPGPGRGPASSGERLDAMREGAMGAVDRFQREGR